MCCGCGVRSRSRCCLGAALARAARLRTSADDDHRPARHLALVSLPVCAVRPARLAPVPSVPPAQIAALFAGAADAEARCCSRISRAARRAPPHDDADAVLGRHHLFPRARGAARQVQLNSSRRLVGDRDADHLRLGKVFGSIVMLIALDMFALPTAILSAGFSQESARREFVVTWSMVARVPLFSTLDAAEVAEVTKLLYTRSSPAPRSCRPATLAERCISWAAATPRFAWCRESPSGCMKAISSARWRCSNIAVIGIPWSPTRCAVFMCWTARGWRGLAGAIRKSSGISRRWRKRGRLRTRSFAVRHALPAPNLPRRRRRPKRNSAGKVRPRRGRPWIVAAARRSCRESRWWTAKPDRLRPGVPGPWS